MAVVNGPFTVSANPRVCARVTQGKSREAWILAHVVSDSPFDQPQPSPFVRVEDAFPDAAAPTEPRVWDIDSRKAIPFPYKGIPERGDKVLALWKDEEGNWSSVFYEGTIVAMAEAEGNTMVRYKGDLAPTEVPFDKIVLKPKPARGAVFETRVISPSAEEVAEALRLEKEALEAEEEREREAGEEAEGSKSPAKETPQEKHSKHSKNSEEVSGPDYQSQGAGGGGIDAQGDTDANKTDSNTVSSAETDINTDANTDINTGNDGENESNSDDGNSDANMSAYRSDGDGGSSGKGSADENVTSNAKAKRNASSGAGKRGPKKGAKAAAAAAAIPAADTTSDPATVDAGVVAAASVSSAGGDDAPQPSVPTKKPRKKGSGRKRKVPLETGEDVATKKARVVGRGQRGKGKVTKAAKAEAARVLGAGVAMAHPLAMTHQQHHAMMLPHAMDQHAMQQQQQQQQQQQFYYQQQLQQQQQHYQQHQQQWMHQQPMHSHPMPHGAAAMTGNVVPGSPPRSSDDGLMTRSVSPARRSIPDSADWAEERPYEVPGSGDDCSGKKGSVFDKGILTLLAAATMLTQRQSQGPMLRRPFFSFL